MNYIVNPKTIVERAKTINGYEKIKPFLDKVNDVLLTAEGVAGEWTNDWDEDQGFGSSDGTYMLKDFIDNVIWKYAGGKFETKFTPSLSVVEYSEMEHHNMVQRMESGI